MFCAELAGKNTMRVDGRVGFEPCACHTVLAAMRQRWRLTEVLRNDFSFLIFLTA